MAQGFVAASCSCTYRLWYTDAEEIEVADSGELKDDLLGNKVPDGVAGGSDIIGNEGVTAPRIDEGRIVGDS